MFIFAFTCWLSVLSAGGVVLRAACWVGKLMNYSPVCFMISGHALPNFAQKCVCGSCHCWPAAVSMGWRKSGFSPYTFLGSCLPLKMQHVTEYLWSWKGNRMTSADPMAWAVVSGGAPLRKRSGWPGAALISFAVKNWRLYNLFLNHLKRQQVVNFAASCRCQ